LGKVSILKSSLVKRLNYSRERGCTQRIPLEKKKVFRNFIGKNETIKKLYTFKRKGKKRPFESKGHRTSWTSKLLGCRVTKMWLSRGGTKGTKMDRERAPKTEKRQTEKETGMANFS